MLWNEIDGRVEARGDLKRCFKELMKRKNLSSERMEFMQSVLSISPEEVSITMYFNDTEIDVLWSGYNISLETENTYNTIVISARHFECKTWSWDERDF